MGCWNGTCNISNMPIFVGDKVVLIPLMRVHNSVVFNACYPTDNFIPIGFPIVGRYNDYGGLEDIEISDVNRGYFDTLNFYFAGREEEEKYRKVKKYDNFEDFVNNVLCCVEGCYVDVSNMDELLKESMIKDNMAEVNYMMVHYDLYQSLMDNMCNRKPYQKEETFEYLLTEKFNSIFMKDVDRVKDAKSMAISMDGRVNKAADMLQKMIIRNMVSELFNKADNFYENRWNYFVEIMIEDESVREELIKCAVDKYIFMVVLSRMRKGYLCDSGVGGQCEETKLHLIMADFIRNQIMKNAERYEDIAKINGVEEYLFF